MMLKAPTIAPSSEGENFTLIWQLWPALTLLQLLVCVYPPLTPMWLIVSVVARLFVSVTLCALLLVPTAILPKSRLPG
jgi:hypothetical protein